MPRLRKKERHAEDFQMAPMIDMVFLLLVFFMCVSTLAEAEKSIELDLPESDEAEVPEDLAGRGKISVDTEGKVFLGPEQVSLEELADTIRSELAKNPELKIYVRADRETSFAHVKKVLKTCAESGAYKVVYASLQR